MKKGQLTIEFMFGAGALMLLVIIIAAIVSHQRLNVLKSGISLSEQDECLGLTGAIVAAATNPGSTISLTLAKPATVHGAQQTIDVGNSICRLSVAGVRGTSGNTFDLAKGDVLVTSTWEGVRVINN